MKDPRRWLLILVAATFALSIFFSRQTVHEKRARGQCLVHDDCLKTERCLVFPKGDGFATTGQCMDLCDENQRCPPQRRCRGYFEADGFLVPSGAQGAGRQAVRVCAPHASQK